ncbi:Serine/threonine-protein phosphatase 2A activator [Fusarium keratoplasticum]|uniref:Serine/threonine-protein phosphatase 2A activator n=1 Tax=Fusarium keratoplasticum TaxID=1328300 RepID=A0ACC0RAB8_9HYPO|nr:Serine/threonine-protein phosphatase 2A activator [Fusarium keratoplasticum]KAI8680234.1 Serine/threonine-protein phosphatase 2A activator [Fusarium keratoplasticum]KAI8686306.1 Serine/threonine-protein phosphatase 2A activator [Fusarium keratoplasticum]
MTSASPPKPPTLEVLDLSSPPSFTKPSKRIHEGPDVARFLTSLAYRDIGIFILQLNHALCPRNQPSSPRPRTFPLTSKPPTSPSIQALQSLLSKIERFIDDAPPDPGPRRFGNVSFRKWYAILEKHLNELLGEGLLGETLKVGDGAALEEVSSYLLGGFGSVQRLDYGTGHELSFVAFLGCLWKLGYFKDGNTGGEIEREIVLNVIEPYLRVVRKLILTYTLEPAGSHGVWGLDDHSFMPYIFGSAQLARPINDTEPMPTEGSVKGAPKPSDVTKATVVEDQRQVNMYFSAIGFINDVKKGPFWEHSPILFDISGIRDGWGKINKGMIKMFNAEVLSKFPVVQHFPFGSLFSWEIDPEAATPTQSVHMANQPTQMPHGPPSGVGTAAPWAQATRMPAPTGPGIPYSRMPPPGPSSGSLARPHQGGAPKSESTGGQITMTKAPWARDE